MKPTIFPIKAFSDNYIWCLHDHKHAVIVDPGQSDKVINYLQNNNLELDTILITHHHYDHIDGVNELCEKYNCDVIQPEDQRIPLFENSSIANEDSVIHIESLNLNLNVLSVPGHTVSHIAYYNNDLLFCGDSLFSLGCGRMFEGNPKQMLGSLNKFKQLSKSTKVYCTHEYTMGNLNFSLSLLPNDPQLLSAKKTIEKKLSKDNISLPSDIGFELSSNLFLRTDNNDLINRLKSKGFENMDSEVAVFAALRQLKDEF